MLSHDPTAPDSTTNDHGGTWVWTIINYKIYILVSGTPKDDTIIKRPLLSPAYMEHMGLDNASQSNAKKNLYLMRFLNNTP